MLCYCDLFRRPNPTPLSNIAKGGSCECWHLALFSVSAQRPGLFEVLVRSVVCPASSQRVDPFNECFSRGCREGGRGHRTRADLCCRGSDYACCGASFPGCCVCVGAAGSRQMLQMKEVVCWHGGEKSVFLRSDPSESAPLWETLQPR